jgi:DNA-binding ferritin-like protein
MAAGVVLKLKADLSQAKRELTATNKKFQQSQDQVKALAKDVKRMGRELEKTGKKGKKSAEDSGTALKGMAGKVMGVVGAYTSLSGAINLVNREMAQQIELQAKAAGVQITVASSRKDIIRNLPGASAEKVREVLAASQAISAEFSIDEASINAAFATALSSTGGNVEASTGAVRAASQFLADRPGQIGEFAGSITDLAAVTGTDDPEVNLGLLTTVAGLSRVTDPGQQSQNIPKALINQLAFGSTAQGATALFAALTTGGAEKTGRSAGTAGIRLAQQLSEFAPELDTTTERIQTLQADPKRAAEFLEKATFDAGIEGAIRQLFLDPLAKVSRDFARNLKMLPDEAGLREVGRRTIANFAIDPLERTAQLKRAFDTIEQELLLSNLEGAEGGVSRKGVEGILKASGASAIGTKLRQIGFEAGTGLGREGAATRAIDIFRLIQESREAPTDFVSAGGRGVEVSRVPTERDREVAEILERAVATLESIVARTAPPIELTPVDGSVGNAPTVLGE